MSIEEMYKKRMKATLKGLLFLFLIPSPGLAIESFSQARSYDAQVLTTFDVVPDYDLNIMKDRQTLFDITTNILNGIKEVLEKEKEPIVVICPNQNKEA